jgi:dynein heavy chain
VFGFYETARDAQARSESQQLLATLAGLGAIGALGAQSFDEEEARLKEMHAALVAKIPRSFDVEALKEQNPPAYDRPLSSVLVQEVERYNGLFDVLHESLASLSHALTGFAIMTEPLDAMGQSLLRNEVPVEWRRVSFLSVLPLATWTDELVHRRAFFDAWRETPPETYWLGGFFYPQGLLTAMLQTTARARRAAFDSVGFSFALAAEDYELTELEHGFYARGLVLEGAGYNWDKEILEPPATALQPIPYVIFHAEVDHVRSVDNSYECPVYITPTRHGSVSTTGHSSNFVLNVDLPTSQPSKVWIQAGVALLLSAR